MAEHALALGPQLPRIFTSVALEADADVFHRAVELAHAGAADATLLHGSAGGPISLTGDRVWQPLRGDLVFSIIIRSELDRRQAAEVSLLLATALGQALSQQITPLTVLQLQWPDTLLLNEGQVARLWLHAPDNADWLVVGAAVNLTAREEDAAIVQASLSGDGGAEADADDLLVDTSRQFLRLLNQWSDSDLDQCLSFWRRRVAAPAAAEEARLDRNGDLLIKPDLDQAIGEKRCDLTTHCFADAASGDAHAR